MKKSIYLFLCLVMVQGVAIAQEWNTDLAVARKKAAAANKNILLVFSGSDWCIPCMYLDKTVWPSREFKTAAGNRWVLLRADFLQKTGDPEPVDVNDMKMILTEKYNRDGFFPFFVMLDKNGKVLSKSGYEDLASVEEHVAKFKKMEK